MLFLIPTLLFIVQTSLFSATEPTEIPSKIEKVTVFKQGAQVTRLASMTIPKGKTAFKFSELPASFDAKSLQVKGAGEFTILSIRQQKNTSTSPYDTAAILVLTMTNDTLAERVEEWNLQVKVLQEEETLILNNDKKTDKEKNKLSVEELQAMAIFYREQIGDIRLQKLQLQRKIKAYQKIINKNNQAINGLKRAAKRITTKEVVATILAEQATKGKLELNYLVPNAGWTPTYDLRVQDVESPVNLVYKANVHQQTGEVWDNVKLTLSTANPKESGIQPTIRKWNLGFYNSYANKRKENLKMMPTEEMADMDLEEVVVTQTYGKSNKPSAAPKPVTTTTYQKATSVEFQIEERYSIKKDGKKYMVNIKELDIPAYYEHYCAPRLDKDVFLNARITDWEQYDLLSGTTSLYFEGTFLGNSVLKVENLQDTMHLSLGRDKSVIVERTLQEDFSKTSFLRYKKMEDKAYKIEIRNKKNQAINLVLEDQFPVSITDDIEVRKGEYEGATLDEKSGVLQWKLAIASEQTKEVEFNYSVKYPSKERVLLD